MRAALITACLLGVAHAQTGVNDDRVSLPEGPGSLEGIGDNASINPNMGAMRFSVPIAVPEGFAGVTPSLALDYSSNAPAGISGIGWDLAVPFIERMTNLGLPRYTADDDFVADGGDQLVRVALGDGFAEYRARFEGGFSRYRWHGFLSGTGGYWTEETPDGITRYYGATADGAPVEGAQAFGRGDAVFRWQLVEVVDPFGHAARYDYTQLGGLPHLDRIQYIFTAGAVGAEVRFEYEPREDRLSDARSGRNEVRTHRLRGVEVFSERTRIWRYDLHYEPSAASGGLSRLSRVERSGLDDTPYPVVFDFEYSRTLGAICAVGCDAPYLVSMGSIGVNLGAGEATLVDMNGDALPDIVDSAQPGAHRIFINTFNARDDHRFEPVARSDAGTRASHQISSPYVQTLDVNGDGRADLANVRTGEVLYNLGAGDWSAPEALDAVDDLPDFGEEFAVGAEELTHVRFFDFDNDRRIDVLRATDATTEIHRNLGGLGFVVAPDVERIGAGFGDQRLEMADLNGDGLQDPVLVQPGLVRFRINLGLGQWTAWREIGNLPFNDAQIDFVELEDINGDSLDDIVIVQADRIQYALNRGGDRFGEVVEIRGASGRALPSRIDGTTVLFADMNGSGSDDVVWITAAGDVTYLELFPLRPNLLTRITNGLGLVTAVEYTTSVEMSAQADAPWAYTLPFPMLMARSIDTYDAFNAVHTLTEYTYRDAYYDPVDKALRGFGAVDIRREGDPTQQGSLRLQTYALGIDDPWRKGLLLSEHTFALDADGAPAPLNTVRTEYADCPVDGVADAERWPVRSICPVAKESVIQEQAAPDAWVTTRETYRYDGYGNRVEEANLGAVEGAICRPCDRPDGLYGAPCGPDCVGDERYTWTTYAPPTPDGRWMLRLMTEQRISADPDGAEASEERMYYDGAPFFGLPFGEFTDGLVSRSTQRVDAERVIAIERNRYDAHGNVVEAINPNGDPDRRGDRVLTTYDDEALLATRIDHELVDDAGPYRLRQDYGYERIWGQVAQASNLRVQRGVDALTTRVDTRYAYDNIGRLARRALPGDDLDRPTEAYRYEPGDPVSRVVIRRRSRAGALLPDVEEVQCHDGFGRRYQIRHRLADGDFEVDRFIVRNRLGEVVRRHRPHRADGAACALEPPDALAVRTRNDVSGRVITEWLPDEGMHGTPSEARFVYRPLTTVEYDASDTDPASPHADSPMVRTFDGLGRITAVEYRAADDAPGPRWRFFYDALGHLAAVEDPAGNLRSQAHDRAGRTIRVDDPNRGSLRFEYDAAGNRVRRVDAAGRDVRTEYDGLGRMTARWDAADPDGTRERIYYDTPDWCVSDACDFTAGKTVGEAFPGGARWFEYDARGRKTAETLEVAGARLTTTYTYDNLDRQIGVILPDGTQIDRAFDATGRIVAIPGLVDAVRYARALMIETIELANGLVERWQYDALDRAVAQQVEGAERVLDLRYDLTRAGLLQGVEDAAPGEGPGLGLRVAYDHLDRVIRADLDPARAAFAETIEYRYDAIDNLLARRSSRGAASPAHRAEMRYGEGDAGPNVLTRADDLVLDHDVAGYLVQRGDLTLAWDGFGRLTAAERDAEAVLTSLPGIGASRVQVDEGARRNLLVHADFEVEDGMALTRVYLGEMHLATIETADLAARVVRDPDGDARITAADALLVDGAPIDRRRALRTSVRTQLLEGERRVVFHHHDRGNNLVATTDAQGEVIERTAWYPSGVPRHAATTSRWGLDGKQTDRSTGMTFYGSRYYAADLGRWISPDFAFDDLKLFGANRPREAGNAYLYAFHSPFAFGDLEGAQGKPKTVNGRAQTPRQSPSAYERTVLNRARKKMFLAEKSLVNAEVAAKNQVHVNQAKKVLLGDSLTPKRARQLQRQLGRAVANVVAATVQARQASQDIAALEIKRQQGTVSGFGFTDAARSISQPSSAVQTTPNTTALSPNGSGRGLAAGSKSLSRQNKARRKKSLLKRVKSRLGKKSAQTAKKSGGN